MPDTGFVLTPAADQADLVPAERLPRLLGRDDFEAVSRSLDVDDREEMASFVFSAWVHLGDMPDRVAPQMGGTLVAFLDWLPVVPSHIRPCHLEEFSTARIGGVAPDLQGRRLRLHAVAAFCLAMDVTRNGLFHLNSLQAVTYPDLTAGPQRRPLTDDEAVVVRLAAQSTLAARAGNVVRATAAALALSGAHPAEVPLVDATDLSGELDTFETPELEVSLAGTTGFAPRRLKLRGWAAEQAKTAWLAHINRLHGEGMPWPFNDRLAYQGAETGEPAGAASRAVLNRLLHSSGITAQAEWILDSHRLTPRPKGGDLAPSSLTLWAAADAYQRTGSLDYAAFILGAVRQRRGRWMPDTTRTAHLIHVR